MMNKVFMLLALVAAVVATVALAADDKAWAEDPTAQAVHHVDSEAAFDKLNDDFPAGVLGAWGCARARGSGVFWANPCTCRFLGVLTRVCRP